MPRILVVHPATAEVDPIPNLIAILLFAAGTVLAVVGMAIKTG
jgi:hypothetical protein